MWAREVTLKRFKGRLAAGEVVVGMQHNSASEAVIELLGYTGFDFVIIDMEHSGYSLTVVERLIRAAEGAGVVGLIRVLENDPATIMQAMDTGAQGILVPHIQSADECNAALAAMRFAPEGVRGKTMVSRAAAWGMIDWHLYQAWANTEPLLIPIIEDREAVDVLEDILSVPGLELISVGPGDLSQSYDMPGLGLRAPPVMAALERTLAYCVPRGIGVMTVPIPDLTNAFARDIVNMGAKAIWYGSDLLHTGRRFQELASVKS